MTVVVPIKPLDAEARVPQYSTVHSAGVDLTTIEDFALRPKQTRVCRTGIAVAIPKDHVGLVCSRSGLAAKQQVCVLNAPGIIDADYRGELLVILFNAGTIKRHFLKGDRIAQLVFAPFTAVKFRPVQELEETVRGVGGLGSTGVGEVISAPAFPTTPVVPYVSSGDPLSPLTQTISVLEEMPTPVLIEEVL